MSFFSVFLKFSSLCLCLFSRPEIYLLSRFHLLTYLLSFFWFPVSLHYLSSFLGNISHSSCILSFVFPLLLFPFLTTSSLSQCMHFILVIAITYHPQLLSYLSPFCSSNLLVHNQHFLCTSKLYLHCAQKNLYKIIIFTQYS